jgi:hypothetical protein
MNQDCFFIAMYLSGHQLSLDDVSLTRTMREKLEKIIVTLFIQPTHSSVIMSSGTIVSANEIRAKLREHVVDQDHIQLFLKKYINSDGPYCSCDIHLSSGEKKTIKVHIALRPIAKDIREWIDIYENLLLKHGVL